MQLIHFNSDRASTQPAASTTAFKLPHYLTYRGISYDLSLSPHGARTSADFDSYDK